MAIGVINIDSGRSCALYEIPGQGELSTEKDGLRTFISGSEALILEKFWEFLGRDDRFISFNGRQFDGPFLMIRSAINGIAPKRDLVGYRYNFHPNCDLREVLNFTGSINFRQMRFNLDLACRAFGVTSSKSEGMDGRAVESMYRAGRYRDIADYCLEDVRATAELYQKLSSTILQLSLRDPLPSATERADSEPEIVTGGPDMMESIEQKSISLTTEEESAGPRGRIGSDRQPAAILEKLIRKGGTPPGDSDDL